MPLSTDSLWKPACCVIVAGFQNIADSEPPAATPAKDDPCPQALCSRTAKPPAFASAVAASNTPIPLHANRTAFTPRNDITQPPKMLRQARSTHVGNIVPLESAADNGPPPNSRLQTTICTNFSWLWPPCHRSRGPLIRSPAGLKQTPIQRLVRILTRVAGAAGGVIAEYRRRGRNLRLRCRPIPLTCRSCSCASNTTPSRAAVRQITWHCALT